MITISSTRVTAQFLRDTHPFECAMPDVPPNSSGGGEETNLSQNCPKKSDLFNSYDRHLPAVAAKKIKLKINLIFLQNDKGKGNFEENNPVHTVYIDNMLARTNQIFANLKDDPGCAPNFFSDSKVEFVATKYFIRAKFYWDSDNCNTGSCCPE